MLRQTVKTENRNLNALLCTVSNESIAFGSTPCVLIDYSAYVWELNFPMNAVC